MVTTKTKTRTITEVIEGLEKWNTEHDPWDKQSKFNLFGFMPPRVTGTDQYALVPFELEDQKSNIPPMFFQERALKQYLGRLGIPVDLFRSLSEPLQTNVVNYLVQNGKYDSTALFRIQDGMQMRAVLSKQYNPFDNLELLKMVAPLVPADTKVRWEFNDEETMHISMTFPRTAQEIRVGDVVEQGVHISNSEVGYRSVTVAGYVFRLRCLNGQIGGGDESYVRFRHTGEPQRLRDAVGSAVHESILESTKILAQFKDALNRHIEQPFDELEKIAKSDKGLTRDQFKKALDHLMEDHEDQHNLFGLSQCITRTAQDFEGEQSFDLQRLGTHVLSLPIGVN